MKPVTRCTPKARLSKRFSPKPPMLLPTGPPPPGYAPPYLPPAYYYPYPYPPPYHPHQYAPMPPLQPQPIPPPPPQPQHRKRATKSEAPKPPRLVSSRSASPDATPPADKKSPVMSEEGIIMPHGNDVLMGRGGKNNTHIGNQKLREMARGMREVYIKSRKKHKTDMARQLVHHVFALNPPGRFLQRDPVTMVWEEVDMDTARHKTSQCLRDAATEKSAYNKTKPELDDTEMQVDAVDSATQTTPSRPTTPEQSTAAESADSINRALTPLQSNLTHKIEPSPLAPQPIEANSHHGVRNRMESWELGSIANVLIESWEDNNESFATKQRRGSLDISTGSSRHRMYAWMSNSNHDSVDMDMEDANLIPPEELDAADGDGEPFSLLDVSQLDEEVEMQIWQPEMYEESESPFDTEFFY